MANSTNTNYNFSDRLKGDVSLSVFDKYYLQVQEKKLNRKRDFKLELAMLSPEPVHVNNNALHWLAAGVLSLLGAGYLTSLVITSTGDSLLYRLIAIGVAVTLAVVFLVLFRKGQEHKWIFKTRSSLYPLVEIPYLVKDRDAARQFVKMMQATIDVNVSNRGYSNETLFAGEMRMLRRLVKHKVLSEKAYGKIKNNMLKSHSA